MKKRLQDRKASFIAPIGWLFADLLLAVAMIFLVSNTINTQPQPTPTPRPTITPTHPVTPTANVLILDPKKVTLTLTNIDPDKLSPKDPDPGAVADLKQKIKNAINGQELQNRQAGIAIAYGGADDFSQAERGSEVAAEVYKVLDDLGKETPPFVFCHTAYYDPLFTTLHPHDTVVIDIYFFSQSAGGC